MKAVDRMEDMLERERVANRRKHWVRAVTACNSHCLFCLDSDTPRNVYLPEDLMAAHGVTREQLDAKRFDDRFRALMREMVAVVRRRYDDAAPGTPMLAPESRDCVRAATALYGGILDEIERAGYRVLDRRVSVGPGRRAALAAGGLGRAWLARRPPHTHQASVCKTSENPNATSSTGA